MDLVLVQTYRSTTNKIYVQIRDNDTSRQIELKYDAIPTVAKARADAQAILYPARFNITTENGNQVSVTTGQSLTLQLTPAQKSALTTAKNTIDILISRVNGKLPTDPTELAQLRQDSAYLDWLLNIPTLLGVTNT